MTRCILWPWWERSSGKVRLSRRCTILGGLSRRSSKARRMKWHCNTQLPDTMRSWTYWLHPQHPFSYRPWTLTLHGIRINSWRPNTMPTVILMSGVSWTMMIKLRKIIWPHRSISHVVHGSLGLAFSTCIVAVPSQEKQLVKNSPASYTTHVKSRLSSSRLASGTYSPPPTQVTTTPSTRSTTS